MGTQRIYGLDTTNLIGPQGDAGLSAYEVALAEGFVGSEEEWLESLVGGGVPGDPGPGVPTGGTSGQLLTKDSGTDFDTSWADPPEALPSGGADGQVLTKVSGTDYDVAWEDPASAGATMSFEGPWIPGSYDVGDLVVHDGFLWRAKTTTSAEPTDEQSYTTGPSSTHVSGPNTPVGTAISGVAIPITPSSTVSVARIKFPQYAPDPLDPVEDFLVGFALARATGTGATAWIGEPTPVRKRPGENDWFTLEEPVSLASGVQHYLIVEALDTAIYADNWAACIGNRSSGATVTGCTIGIVVDRTGTTWAAGGAANPMFELELAAALPWRAIAQAGTVQIPDGGDVGQVLAKASSTDYDLEWIDPTGGVAISPVLKPYLIGNPDVTGDVDLDGPNSYAAISHSGSSQNYSADNQDVFIDGDLLVRNGSVLNMRGYRLHVTGTVTVESTGRIHSDGTAAVGRGGGAANSGIAVLPVGTAGGAGPSANVAGNGTAGTGITQGWGAGAGGAGGGSGSSQTGGGGGNQIAAATRPKHLEGMLFGWHNNINALIKALMGSGGGGGGGQVNCTSGGGGSGADLLLIIAKEIINDGSISANGGNGAAATGTGAGAGGGGGGGGGFVVLATEAYSGAGTVTAAGGSGGAAYGTGVAGSAGTAGKVFTWLV